MKVIIFHDNKRNELFLSLKNSLKSYDLTVIDDPQTMVKTLFWARWELARRICLASKQNNYLIIPNDIKDLNIKEVKRLHKVFSDKPFLCNVINDGRISCWGEHRRINNDFQGYKDYGYFDCGGLSNRATLSQIEVKEPHYTWWLGENKSSGVGYQITMQARKLNIPMFTPDKSLCYHGDHESVMHKELRKRQKLIST